MTTQQDKCDAFARLHQDDGIFLIPNPWDIGSARLLQGLGFQALATTSSGFAYTLGKSDGKVNLEEKLKHCAALAAATSIPINVDFEDGYATNPEQVAEHIVTLAATGVAGCSIEDYDRNTNSLYDFNTALERIQAAVEAVSTLDMAFQLTARAENLIRGVNDLDDTISRLKAFEAAGAHVLYAPGLKTLESLQQVTAEIDSPFNVLAPPFKGVTVDEFAEAGAKRISIGGALNLAAVNPVLSAGKEMLEQGTFNWVGLMAPGKDVKRLISD